MGVQGPIVPPGPSGVEELQEQQVPQQPVEHLVVELLEELEHRHREGERLLLVEQFVLVHGPGPSRRPLVVGS